MYQWDVIAQYLLTPDVPVQLLITFSSILKKCLSRTIKLDGNCAPGSTGLVSVINTLTPLSRSLGDEARWRTSEVP